MGEALYLTNCYLKEFEAVVKSVAQGKYIVLDKTAFYPASGGQPYDTGVFIRQSDSKQFQVIYAGKFSGEISHEVSEPGLKEGDKITGRINWERRYKLMRMHTAAHILSAVFHQETGALITGNQLDIEKSRIDFNLESFDREKINDYIKKANEIVKEDLLIKIYTMPKSAATDPALFKLAKGIPEGIDEIRIVDIEGFDKQADGGTHLSSTKEVGKIIFLKAENKGKENRRVYFALE